MKKIVILTALFLCTSVAYAQSSDPLANMFLNENGSVVSNNNINSTASITAQNSNTAVSPTPVTPASIEAPANQPAITATNSSPTPIIPTEIPPTNSAAPSVFPDVSNENSLHAAAPTNTNMNEPLSNSNINGEGGALPQTGGTSIPLLVLGTMIVFLATKSLAWLYSKK